MSQLSLGKLNALGAGVLLFSFVLGCAATGSGAPARSVQKPRTAEGTAPAPGADGAVVDVERQVVAADYDTTIPELYARAHVLHETEKCAEAVPLFLQVARLDAQTDWAPRALHDAALCLEELGDHAGAAQMFERVAQQYPESPPSRDALVRAVRLRVFLEEWDAGAQLAQALLRRYPEGPARERIVAYSAVALQYVSHGDDETAALFVERGRSIVEAERLDMAGSIPRDLAQLYFALGEVRRLRAERIDFEPLPDDFGIALEQRCQLLLDAQSAYSDSMRAYDAHWSSMAGYRVAELYAQLHRDLMRIPSPSKNADRPDRKLLFEGAMRLRYSILLQKARSMLDHTVQLAERTGEKSIWVHRAAQARLDIDRAMAAEQAAIDQLPYTRQQLKAALEELVGQRL